MSDISSSLRAEVVLRAANRCEYCHLSQLGQEATFHIDHVVPRTADGPTTAENLALACVSCSLREGSRQSWIEAQSGEEVPLFNPRTQLWADHFHWNGTMIVATTPTGGATIAALQMNRPLIIGIREEEVIRGRHPSA